MIIIPILNYKYYIQTFKNRFSNLQTIRGQYLKYLPKTSRYDFVVN